MTAVGKRDWLNDTKTKGVSFEACRELVEKHWRVADSSQQCLLLVAEDENKCTQPTAVLWRKRDSLKMRVLQPLLSRGEHLGHSLKGRVPQPLPGQVFIVFLGSYIKEGFIIYYIECCLHFRYNQGNE